MIALAEVMANNRIPGLSAVLENEKMIEKDNSDRLDSKIGSDLVRSNYFSNIKVK